MPNPTYPLLETIHAPDDLRRLPRAQLLGLATELRDYLLHSVARTGGHLSSNLGTVELTVALHYVFNTPDDRLVWDVGHQTYPHKILTGRRERMASLRQLGGLSGFPQRTESEFDAFGTAHSSTLGKTAGKDADNGKPTYVSLMGLQRSQAYAQELLAQAQQALQRSGLEPTHTQALAALADMVVNRAH